MSRSFTMSTGLTMSAEPEPPDTAGELSNTTVHVVLLNHGHAAVAPPVQGPTRGTDPASVPSDVEKKDTDREPSQMTMRQDSVRSTEINRDQTRHPSVQVAPTAHVGDSSPETRASNEFPSLDSANLSFFKDEGKVNFAPGQIIFDRYVARRKLGEGGMGQVWLVTHRELNVERAVKLIVSKVSYDHQARGRFRREAQVLARVNHPHAVTVHDARLTDDDVAYIEMEYVPGQSLDKIFQPGQPMPLKWVARIVDQLCAVLQAAHDLGIIHRDLKPANMMLLDGRADGDEFLKVLDFGIAKVLERDPNESDVRTGTGMFVGTVAYASPEQLLGSAEPGSDIYSIGVILYEFLTGRRPYLGNAHHILQQAVMGDTPAFIAANPEIEKYGYPPALEALVQRCLSKEPANRPQSARELARLFRAAVNIDGESPPNTGGRVPVSVKKVVSFGALGCVVLGLGIWLGPAVKSKLEMTNSRIPKGFREGPTAVDKNGRPSVIIPKMLQPAIGLRLILIEGGPFKLGEGDLGQEVQLEDFAMSETEVTNRQMMAYFKAKGIDSPPTEWTSTHNLLLDHVSPTEALDHPAAGIPHAMAADFARWIGGKLPTEAQWEFAARCRGLPGRRYPWSYPEQLQRGDDRANIDTLEQRNTCTTKVKAYPDDRTPEGIFDLAGNVREWCRDEGLSSGEFIVKGGSWNTFATAYSNMARESVAPQGDRDLGFRVVVEWPGARKH